ncbi:hypothetical protein [Actinokineospora iranica]|uniref:Helix-turn-helix domain-containing protein n=1 Tax=Actinokineospora iranica TaxID=1271860 RepID=A0A1G6P175_9PSEU|nr:hypothetical protein [Actinokineospora iranica]SDC73738.1 hypothetical protein SAMN05216174_10457 [Actinokineospora iranica]
MSTSPAVASEPDGDLTITAADETGFMALMRAMLAHSGLTAGQVAMYAKLPRSTAYRFVSEKNTTLPKHAHQVRAFARGCRLRPEQVEQVMMLWANLREMSTALEIIAPKELVLDAELVDHRPNEQHRDEPVLQRLTGGMGSVAVHGDINIAYNTHHNITNHRYSHSGAQTDNATQDEGASQEGTNQRSGERRRRPFLRDLLDNYRWVLNAVALLSALSMILFAFIALLLVDGVEAYPATAMVLLFAGMTLTVLRLLRPRR